MKIIIILILAVTFVFQDGYSNEAILSKLHQNAFKLKDVRMQLMDYDKDVYSLYEIKAFKYNRSTTAHNMTFRLKVDSKDNTEVLVQVYKFYSNEYRRFPIRFQVNLKKTFDSNAIGLREARKCGNMSSYYFYKDITYYACNLVINEKRFPPLIPSGKYRIGITMLYFNKEIAWISIFAEVYTPIPYPKK